MTQEFLNHIDNFNILENGPVFSLRKIIGLCDQKLLRDYVKTTFSPIANDIKTLWVSVKFIRI